MTGDCCVERAERCGEAKGEPRRELGWEVCVGAGAREDCGCCGEVDGDGSGESAGSGGTVRIRSGEADIDLGRIELDTGKKHSWVNAHLYSGPKALRV